jgi:hypothetical protein
MTTWGSNLLHVLFDFAVVLGSGAVAGGGFKSAVSRSCSFCNTESLRLVNVFQSSEYLTVEMECSEWMLSSSESLIKDTLECLPCESPRSCEGMKLVKIGSTSSSPVNDFTLSCFPCLRGLCRVVGAAKEMLLAGESNLDCERRLYGDVCVSSCAEENIERVRAAGGETVARAPEITDVLDLNDLVVR